MGRDEPSREVVETSQQLAIIAADPYHRGPNHHWRTSSCPICSAGCALAFELSEAGGIVRIHPAPEDAGNIAGACIQGRRLLEKSLRRPDRLTHPLMAENGRYRKVDWDAALGLTAARLSGCDAWETAVLADAALGTEELFLLQKFARTILKTNLVGCITRSGHSPAEALLGRNGNRAALRGSLRDATQAGTLLLIGVDPAATHPAAEAHLREAVRSGAALIVANPCSVGVAGYCTVGLHHRPGAEPVLIAGLIRLLLEQGRAAPAFTARYPQYLQMLKKRLADYHPARVARITGVSADSLRQAASLLGAKQPLSVWYGPGVLQSWNVRESMKALVTLLHLTGSIGSRGGGLVPLYGSGNLHGALDLGLASQLLWTSVAADKPTGLAYGDLREMLLAGRIRALYVAAESLDDSLLDRLRPFLESVEFVVLHDMAPPLPARPGTKPPADVVLPMASVLEKGGTFLNLEREARRIVPVLPAPGEARSVLWTLQQLARRMKAGGFAHGGEPAVAEEVRKCLAAGSAAAARPRTSRGRCLCCHLAADAKSAAGSADDVRDWAPVLSALPESSVDEEFPFAAVPVEMLLPYVSGPLAAGRAKLFTSGGDIQLNPGQALKLGLKAGDRIVIAARAGESEGKLGVNPLLPAGLAAVSAALFAGLRKKDGPAPGTGAVQVAIKLLSGS